MKIATRVAAGALVALVAFSSLAGYTGDTVARGKATTHTNTVQVFGPTFRDGPLERKLTEFEQQRARAAAAYMSSVGFKPGQFVVGLENADLTATELHRAGSDAFNANGAQSREELQASFDARTPEALLQIAKFPSREQEIMNAQNWEFVQVLVAVKVIGNTGLSGGEVVSVGTTESAAGEGGWVFVDTKTWTVPAAEVQPANVGDTPAVAYIRPGCLNAGDGIQPKNPALDPWVQGNANILGGPNAIPGPGTEKVVDQPGTDPYVAPVAPPAPPGPPAGSTEDNTPPPATDAGSPPAAAPQTVCAPIEGSTNTCG